MNLGGTLMRTYGFLALAVVVPLAGCDLFVLKPPRPAAQAQPQASSPTPGTPVAGTPPGVAPAVGPGVTPAVGSGASAIPPGVERNAAGVGSGIKGRTLDDPNLVGAIVEPARAYFKTKERIVFEIQVPQALNLYKAD